MAAIEFGVVALPFFLLLLAIMAVGVMMIASATLDFATQKAARKIMTGSVQGGSLSAEQFRTTVLCPLLPTPMFDCLKVVVNLATIQASGSPTAYFTTYVKADQSGLVIPPLSNAKTSFCLGAGGGYQVLEVLYPLPLYLSFFAASSSVVDNQFILMSAATFKNEPFQGGSGGSAAC